MAEDNDNLDEEGKLSSTRADLAIEVVGAALSAVPVAGGPMSAIAAGIISRRQNKRLNRFLVDLAVDMRSVEDRINNEFVRSEEFDDLAEDVFSRAAETRQRSILDALRAVFLNTVLSERPSYEQAAEIASLVGGLQDRHMVMLRILAAPLVADREMGNAVGPATSLMEIFRKLLPDWSEDQIDRTWAELYERKLHSTGGTRAKMTDRGIHHLEGRLTPFGQLVVRFITNPSR